MEIDTILKEIILLATKLGWSKYPILIHKEDGSIGGIMLGEDDVLDIIEITNKEEADVIPLFPTDPAS